MSTTVAILADSAGIEQALGKSVEHSGRKAIWDGFLYDRSGRAEEAAVQEVLAALAFGKSMVEAVRDLFGAFFLVIEDPTEHCRWALVDPSGLYSAYCSDRFVSKSFLQLLEKERVTPDQFLPEQMAEFLQLGNVYFGRTFAPGIRKIRSNELLRIADQKVTSVARPIGTITDPPHTADLLEGLQPFAKAAQGRVLSLDLTGGFDSRLLACLLLSQQVEFETSLSGYHGHFDQVLAEQVAEALGVPFYFTEHQPERIVDELDEVLRRLDGLSGGLGTYHRLLQLNQDRIDRGVQLALKGLGGELYKEFFWVQDFPFYRSRHSRIDRVHRSRMEFELMSPDVLTEDFYRVSLQARKNRVKQLYQYMLPINTQTYDNIYFHERVQTWSSRTVTSCQSRELSTYAPLCELELVRIGFHLPRSRRFYNRVHREYITRLYPEVARVKTSDGTSASAQWLDMGRDVWSYARSKSKKVVKKALQYSMNTTVLDAPRADHNTGEIIIQTELAQRALEALKARGLVRPEVAYGEISPRFQQNFVTLGWLLGKEG